MNGRPSRETWLRIVGVVVITATITVAAACSDEDTVDTVPPPWPTPTVTPGGSTGIPGFTPGAFSPATSTTSQRPTATSGATQR